MDTEEEPTYTELTNFQELELSDTEANLIKRFVCGEVEFPEVFNLQQDDEDDVDCEVDDKDESPKFQICSEDNKKHVGSDEINTDICSGVQSGRVGQQKSRSGTFRKKSVLNAALQGLMGEANLRFARGQIESAEKICLEIIRQNPCASEPFLTLAEINESRDKEKYLNFLTIAAHLNPHDRDQWIRIAEIHVDKGNLGIARALYAKAIRYLYKDYDLRLRRGRLLEIMGETNTAMISYLKLIPLIPVERSELCIVTAKNCAHYFHELKKFQLALEAMNAAFKVCPQLFKSDDLNLYLELLISAKEYKKAVLVLAQCTKFVITCDKENDSDSILYCIIPNDFLPDIRIKLCICLINLNYNHLIDYVINNILTYVPLLEGRLDLYIDIAEALMANQKYAEAIRLLQPIIGNSVIDCPPVVLLRQAECLRGLNRIDQAIETYRNVIKLAPLCYEAKFTLSALLKLEGRPLEAIEALEQSGEADGNHVNARLLYERCKMFKEIGNYDEFFELGSKLLGRHSLKLKNRDEMLAAANGGNFFHAAGLIVILEMRNIYENPEIELQKYSKPPKDSDLTIEDEYKLFLELINDAFECKKYSYIQRLCFAMITTKRFKCYSMDLEPIIILACYYNDDCSIAFAYLRYLITKNISNTSLWNLLSLFVQKGQELRYHRYIRRLIEKQPAARAYRLFLAHYHLYCTSYKYALNIYIPLLKEYKLPIIAFCISVVFNQLSMQKKVLRKLGAVGQSIAFAEHYAELRTNGIRIGDEGFENTAECQEIYYNMGRIYHQAGMMHIAIDYYEKALKAKHPLIEENLTTLDLRPEIAFNLHLIYKASGNFAKARQYLYEYCVV